MMKCLHNCKISISSGWNIYPFDLPLFSILPQKYVDGSSIHLQLFLCKSLLLKDVLLVE